MIHIVRAPCPAVLDFSNSTSLASKELATARAFYAKRSNKFGNLSFTTYKHEEVASTLEIMFHKKCAYCESRYSHISPVDIEHFRPKGGVAIKGILHWPGYWWLAAAWDNLLPSCIDCNRRRRHRFPGEEVDNCRGKENLFPILHEKHRAGQFEGSECKEQPLLLNPCDDLPEKYLDFLKEAGGVVAKKGLKPSDRKRSLQSIRVYGLDRPELCIARSEYQLRVMQQGERVMTAAANLQKKTTVTAQRNLASELQDLNSLRAATSEYAAVARAVTRMLFARLRRKLPTLLGKQAAADGYKDCIEWLVDKFPMEPLGRTPVRDFVNKINALRG